MAGEWREMLKNRPVSRKQVNATVRTILSRLSDEEVTKVIKKAKVIGKEN